MSGLSISPSAAPSSDAVEALISPASRLRLSIPRVSHLQIVVEELLAQLSENGVPAGKLAPYTIVDVRSEDYAGGNLTGSIHSAFDDFETGLDAFVDQAHAAKLTKIVFLCCYGKQRSPLAAETFLSRYKSKYGEDDAPEAFVLSGGFSAFLNAHVTIAADKSVALKADAGKFINAFDASKWTVATVSRTPSNRELGATSAFQLVYKTDVESAHIFVEQKKQ